MEVKEFKRAYGAILFFQALFLFVYIAYLFLTAQACLFLTLDIKIICMIALFVILCIVLPLSIFEIHLLLIDKNHSHQEAPPQETDKLFSFLASGWRKVISISNATSQSTNTGVHQSADTSDTKD